MSELTEKQARIMENARQAAARLEAAISRYANGTGQAVDLANAVEKVYRDVKPFAKIVPRLPLTLAAPFPATTDNAALVIVDGKVYDRAVYDVLERLERAGYKRMRHCVDRSFFPRESFSREMLMAIIAGQIWARQVGPKSRRILQTMIADRPEFRGFPPCTCPAEDCPIHSPLED